MTRKAAAVEEVLAHIGETLRPHCRLSEDDLRRVSEAVLVLGARHALEWAERGLRDDPADAASVTAPSETLGSWKRRFRVRVS